MPSRIEVELTSRRDDETWTWRAAGARQPKGVVDAAIVPAEASTGDVLRAEVEFGVDGIVVLSLGAVSARQRLEPERIEIRGSRRDEPTVTTQLVAKRGKGPRRDRSDERGGDRDRGDRNRGDRDRRGDRAGDRARTRSDGRPDRSDSRPGAGSRDRRDRPARPPMPERPRSKRLKPQRVHRQALLRQIGPEQRPMAEIVLRGGIPGVRQTIDRMNAAAREHGQPPVASEPLLALAEKLLPHLRMAEWHDRADAALAEVDELDLRDLRQVVVAADANARDEATRELAGQLRSALAQRVDTEHAMWLDEITGLLDDGRVVRALRLSSRPPKAGARFPAELAARLTEATAAALAADTLPDRYATVLDALAFAPVRTQVVPAGVPARANDDLLTAVRKLADRLPQVAAAFGIGAPSPAPAPPAPPVPAPPAPPAAIPVPPEPVQPVTAPPAPADDGQAGDASLTS